MQLSPTVRGGLALAVASMITLVGLATGAAGAANVCTTTGITKTVAVRIFGAGASLSGNSKMCTVTGKHYGAIAIVQLSPESHFKADVAYDETAPGGGRLPVTAVSGAGSGAVFIQSQGATAAWLFLIAGPYEVNIQSGYAGQKAPAKLWEALAHTIHAHLG